MKETRSKNADYDGFKKIVTSLRKNVFRCVDIRPKNANYLGFKEILTTLVNTSFHLCRYRGYRSGGTGTGHKRHK
jgi:hypothetical protein